MEPTQELVDSIYREKVLRARATPPEEKLFAGVRLFQAECERMKGEIRLQFPDADESRVAEILQERLEQLRQRSEPDYGLMNDDTGYWCPE